MLETYGADALRLYLLNSPAMKAEELRLSENGIKQSLRDVILPLWNAYSFFVTYAQIDGWDPAQGANAPITHRLDRWILSELQTLLHNINQEMEAYRLYRTVPTMVAFVEKLTNWYIRRSRRRFWKSDDDGDKASAYAALYQVLTVFIRALAPVLPFVTDAIYQNLVRNPGATDRLTPESVHLCDMPLADESLRDPKLEEQMELATRAVTLGRALRSKHNLKTRQPLQRVFLLPPDEHSREELSQVSGLIADELNIKEVVLVEDEAEISEVSYKPNFRTLGPRFGKRIKEVGIFISSLTREQVRDLVGGSRLDVADGDIGIDDVEVQRREREDVVVAVDDNLCVGLDVQVTDDLRLEGFARELVNRVQNMRKDAGLDVADRIHLWLDGSDQVSQAMAVHEAYVTGETLASNTTIGTAPADVSATRMWDVNGFECQISITRVS
jgi:isoleucyl-tRNA synthetase